MAVSSWKNVMKWKWKERIDLGLEMQTGWGGLLAQPGLRTGLNGSKLINLENEARIKGKREGIYLWWKLTKTRIWIDLVTTFIDYQIFKDISRIIIKLPVPSQ